MPDCGVHYLWFAFVCFLIRSHPPSWGHFYWGGVAYKSEETSPPCVLLSAAPPPPPGLSVNVQNFLRAGSRDAYSRCSPAAICGAERLRVHCDTVLCTKEKDTEKK